MVKDQGRGQPIKMTDRFSGKDFIKWGGKWAGLTARFVVQGKKSQRSFKVSVSWRHRQPHCHVLQPHSFQLKVTNSSVIILFSTVLELTSSGILMASFDMEEIPTHVFQQLIATQKQSVLICSRQETYVLCYCVSYWRKHTGRQLRSSCRSL